MSRPYRNAFANKTRDQRFRMFLANLQATMVVAEGGGKKGKVPGSGGSVKPNKVRGKTITELSASTTTITLGLDGGGTQIDGWTSVDTTISGAPESSYTMTWDGTNYTDTNGARATALNSNLSAGDTRTVSVVETPPSSGPAYTHTMNVGTVSTKRGYDQLTAIGTMSPAEYSSVEIYGVFTDTSGAPDFLRLRFGNFGVTQVGSITTLNIIIEGAPESAGYDCVWTGSLYELASDVLITPLHSYLDGQAGNDLQLLFTDAS